MTDLSFERIKEYFSRLFAPRAAPSYHLRTTRRILVNTCRITITAQQPGYPPYSKQFLITLRRPTGGSSGGL